MSGVLVHQHIYMVVVFARQNLNPLEFHFLAFFGATSLLYLRSNKEQEYQLVLKAKQ